MKRYFIAFMVAFMAVGLFAQETTEEMEKEEMFKVPPISLTGSVDAYFRSNSEAPATSFANLNGFALGMVNLVASHEGKKAGFVGDLVFGPRGADAVFLSTGSANIVNQLYAYLNVSDNVTLTLGNFNTFLGYEVISPTGNFNYSTSYMFSYGPFSHTGLKADFSLGGGLSLMLGVFNSTDFTDFQPVAGQFGLEEDADYHGGAQIGYEFDNGGAWVNALFTDGFFQIDFTGGIDVTDALYLGLNATTAQDAFSGVAGYVQVAASDAFKIGGRIEFFDDEAGLTYGVPDESIVAFTISAQYKVDNLTIIPEFRIDSTDSDVFDSGTSGSLASFLVAAVYGF